MKAYRKKLIGLILTAAFCLFPVSAFAAAPLTITSGLEMESDEVECTFDESRILYGEAKPDAEIYVTISKMNRLGTLVEVYTETITVSSVGLFSITLPLEKGCNYITMTVAGEEGKTEAVVKRVPQTVKNRLQRMIALPGMDVK